MHETLCGAHSGVLRDAKRQPGGGRKPLSREGDSAPGDESKLAALCGQAVREAAARLRIPPERLARGLGEGRLAALVLELATTRHWTQAADRQRIDDLLEAIGAPDEL